MQVNDSIYVLTGPTAVGKTALALRWAEQFDAEIVSADSLLFYRGMDIGTAKPSRQELARVPHHLIDSVPVTDMLNVRRYVSMALEAVRGIQNRGKRVLVTGGSGFYLKAFFAPVADDLVSNTAVRAEVDRIIETAGIEGLRERLAALNPDGLGKLDVHNPVRVARALERCLTAGKPLLELERIFAQTESPFAAWPKQCVLLDSARGALWERIQQRTHAMLAAGLVEEVRALKSAGLMENPSAARAIGYRETLDWLESSAPLSELEESINISTRQLVAKQRKWFRNQLKPDRIVSVDDGEPAVDTLFTVAPGQSD